MAHALVRAASAFWSTLVRRSQKTARVEAFPVEALPAGKPDAPRASISSGLPAAAGIENRCPVCQARFRGSRICSRCGADLEPLMRLTVRAWQLRQAARRALDAGDFERALELAIEAQSTQRTDSGEALRLLGAWLRAGSRCSTTHY
jgi:hypothetical protein